MCTSYELFLDLYFRTKIRAQGLDINPSILEFLKYVY
jgi:hypothetical protein